MGTFDVADMKCLRFLFPELVQSYYSYRDILVITGTMWLSIEPRQGYNMSHHKMNIILLLISHYQKCDVRCGYYTEEQLQMSPPTVFEGNKKEL